MNDHSSLIYNQVYNGSFVDGNWDGEGVWHGIKMFFMIFLLVLFVDSKNRISDLLPP